MKKLAFYVTAMLLIVLGSCTKSSDQLLLPNSVNKHTTSAAKPIWYLYYAHWEEWGRKARDCDGNGLCYFRHCLDCVVDAAASAYHGPIKINAETNQGLLTIELDPNDAHSSEAIVNKLDFYIDADIVNNELTLKQGVYSFNPEIGRNGGYEVNVTRNR